MSWLSKLTGSAKPDARPVSAVAAPRAKPAEPPRIVIDHHDYRPEEIAMGSFRIRPYDGDLIAKQHFDFKLSFVLDDEPLEFLCHGMVVKMDDKAGLVARFQLPQPYYERKLIEYMRLWKGV
ncbi:hypothetical protein [Azospirillum sp. SYSU D00513]|uniref:hypothetical protein n=1 Tax=Azospirillum sp. SYSU D00513 TaxID=2812561 RepID=UPI001A96D799|nr:hypothetical protein [Azospirillum sp. SYSU D00513]